MTYPLLLLKYHHDFLLVLQYDTVFDLMVNLYLFMDIQFDIIYTNLEISTQAYLFLIKTLGNKYIKAVNKEELLQDINIILKFYDVKFKYNSALIKPEQNLVFSKQDQSCILYNLYFGISFVVPKNGAYLSLLYSEFDLIEYVDLNQHKNLKDFFHVKKWQNKEELIKKLNAFLVLFS